MALSGSFTTSGYEGRCWKFSWTASQNVGANTSTISYTVEAIGGSAGWYMTGPCKVVVAGNIVYNNTGRWKQYKGKLNQSMCNSNSLAYFKCRHLYRSSFCMIMTTIYQLTFSFNRFQIISIHQITIDICIITVTDIVATFLICNIKITNNWIQ